MNERIVSAVFDSRDEAQQALAELRSAGIPDEAISIVGKSESGDGSGMSEGHDDDGANKSGAVKGAIGGAAAGGLLGLAALAIPGVGPLAAAGAIAASAMPEAAAIGAGVGATMGGLSGLLAKHGVSDEDAKYYEERLGQGGYWVGVHTDKGDFSPERAQELLYRYGGHSAGQPRQTTSQSQTQSTF